VGPRAKRHLSVERDRDAGSGLPGATVAPRGADDGWFEIDDVGGSWVARSDRVEFFIWVEEADFDSCRGH